MSDLVVGAQLRDHAVALLHVAHERLLLVESLVEFVERSNQLRLLLVVLALGTLQLFFLEANSMLKSATITKTLK